MERLIKHNLATHKLHIGIIFFPITKNSYCKNNPHSTAVGVIVAHSIVQFQ